MKVTIGTKVYGECGMGEVIAMTEQWCIYLDRRCGEEIAEPWSSIRIPAEPGETVSSITEKEIDG